jgi:hypothetical protein
MQRKLLEGIGIDCTQTVVHQRGGGPRVGVMVGVGVALGVAVGGTFVAVGVAVGV